MNKPELPEWIVRIQTKIEKVEKKAAELAYEAGLGASEYEAFLSNADKAIITLLQHCLKLREALAFFQNPDDWEDYYEPDTGYGYFRFFKREDLEAGMPFDLVAEALNTKPEGVL